MKKSLPTYQGSPMKNMPGENFISSVLTSIVRIACIQLADTGMKSTSVKAQILCT